MTPSIAPIDKQYSLQYLFLTSFAGGFSIYGASLTITIPLLFCVIHLREKDGTRTCQEICQEIQEELGLVHCCQNCLLYKYLGATIPLKSPLACKQTVSLPLRQDLGLSRLYSDCAMLLPRDTKGVRFLSFVRKASGILLGGMPHLLILRSEKKLPLGVENTRISARSRSQICQIVSDWSICFKRITKKRGQMFSSEIEPHKPPPLSNAQEPMSRQIPSLRQAALRE